MMDNAPGSQDGFPFRSDINPPPQSRNVTYKKYGIEADGEDERGSLDKPAQQKKPISWRSPAKKNSTKGSWGQKHWKI